MLTVMVVVGAKRVGLHIKGRLLFVHPHEFVVILNPTKFENLNCDDHDVIDAEPIAKISRSTHWQIHFLVKAL